MLILVRGLTKILKGMPRVRNYIDDIVIFSDSWEDHLRMLKEQFWRKRHYITLSHDNLEKVRNTSRPITKKQVRSFFSLVGYYRDHIPSFPKVSAPLTDIMKKGKAEHIQWSNAQELKYSLLKQYLLQERVLKLPDLSKPFIRCLISFGYYFDNVW